MTKRSRSAGLALATGIGLLGLAAPMDVRAQSDADRFQMYFSNHKNEYIRGIVQNRQYLYLSPNQQEAFAYVSVNIVGSPRTYVVQEVNFVHFTNPSPVYCTWHLILTYENGGYTCEARHISSAGGAICTNDGTHAFRVDGSVPDGGCKYYVHYR